MHYPIDSISKFSGPPITDICTPQGVLKLSQISPAQIKKHSLKPGMLTPFTKFLIVSDESEADVVAAQANSESNLHKKTRY